MSDAIQRWSPYAVDGGDDAHGEMEEDQHGDFVNFEDHKAALNAANSRAEAAEAQAKTAREDALREAVDAFNGRLGAWPIDAIQRVIRALIPEPPK